MPQFMSIFLIIVFSLSIIVFGIGEVVTRKEKVDIDAQYYNADGDHVYYERSLIEKKRFSERYPHISVRKFSSMFTRRRVLGTERKS